MLTQLLCIVQDTVYRYREAIEAVTADDVTRAARQHLHPLDHTIVIAADAGTVKPLLEAKGFDVRPLEMSRFD